MPTPHRIAQVEQHVLQRAHRSVERLLDRLEATAALTAALPADALAAALDRLLDEAARTLRPHIEWEEQVCFPDTERVAGAAWATRLLRLQHAELGVAVDRLAADRAELARQAIAPARVAAHVYALHALLASHLEQEERVILGLLLELPDPPQPGACGDEDPPEPA